MGDSPHRRCRAHYALDVPFSPGHRLAVARFLDCGTYTLMSVADVLGRSNLSAREFRSGLREQRAVPLNRVAAAGLAALVIVAPFEALRPLLRVPGQSLTTVEAVLLAVVLATALTAVRDRAWRSILHRDLAPAALFVVVSGVTALAAPEFRSNALHMSVRFGLAAMVWALARLVASSSPERGRLIALVFGSGVLVAALVIADFAGVPGVAPLLSIFRDGVATVGAQVRASGPFQYPTITSMYLETTFALGLGLLAARPERPAAVLVGLVLALALTAEAIVLTFTRSGLITVAVSLGVVGALHWRRHGSDRVAACLVAVVLLAGAALGSSRSAEALALRLTSETQGQWYAARFDAPRALTIEAGQTMAVPLRVTNIGRATWDSSAADPIKLSYHWLDEHSDVVLAWEGLRTSFPSPVPSGEAVSVVATIDAPVAAGRHRLVWDLEQEDRLWFSTEPGAVLSYSDVTVRGSSAIVPARRGGPARMPGAAVRPGRVVLWGAALRMLREHPWLGVGPDNFRLLYGRYGAMVSADPRVHSNNTYIEIAAGMGLVGVAALAWLLARAAGAVARCCSAGGIELGVAAACLAIAVHGLADSFLSFTGTYIVMAVALGLASACPDGAPRHAYRV